MSSGQIYILNGPLGPLFLSLRLCMVQPKEPIVFKQADYTFAQAFRQIKNYVSI